uniref:DNA polymerase III subunit beta family protein n=1 Tax=Stappia sp. TaxID=1870903 RepID=UPI003BAB8973
MHIETTAGQLRKALKTVKPVVTGWRRVPVLSCVRISACEVGAALDATDLDIHYRLHFAASSTGDAVFVLDHAVLSRLVCNLPGSEAVRLERGADGNVVLVFRSSRYRLAAMPATEWPEPGEIAPDGWSGPAGAPFVEGLRFCAPCISREETRYYLNGVCLDGREMAATDGHRLASCASGLSLPPQLTPIVPHEVVKLMIAARDVTALRIGACWLRADVPGGHITARLIDGRFPDWRRVVPGAVAVKQLDALMRVDLDRAEAMEAVTRLRALDGPAVPSLGMVLAEGRVALTSLSRDIGTGEEYLRKSSWCWVSSPWHVSARPLVAAVAPQYLLQMLGTLRGEQRVSLWLRHIEDAEQMAAPLTMTAFGEEEPPVTPAEGETPGRRLVLMPQRSFKHDDGLVAEVAARLVGSGAMREAAE